jgi:hypothetical protein
MDPILHQEYDVVVVATRPWGLEVEFWDGTPGLIDNTKDPDWPAGDRNAIVGKTIRTTVVDDERVPVRLSALGVDLDIARAKRASGGEIV